MEKEFGTLSRNQVLEFCTLITSFIDDLPDEFDNSDLSLEEFPFHLIWYPLFEKEISVVFGFMLGALNLNNELLKAQNSGDFNQHFLDLYHSNPKLDITLHDMDQKTGIQLCASIISLITNFICFSAYRTSINQLVSEARLGHDISLFQAINIDQSVVCTKVAGARISKAILEDDGYFFEQLSKAIKGSYPKDKPSKYIEVCFIAYIIESNPGAYINYEVLHEICTKDLNIYPDETQLNDSFGSFKRLIQRTKHKVKDKKS